MHLNLKSYFEHENEFYLHAPISRIAKFSAQMELFRKVACVPGDIVECGVYKGVSLSRLIKFREIFENIWSKKIIAFDTFGEFPKTQYEFWKKERRNFIKEAGDRKSVPLRNYVRLLKSQNLYHNIDLIKGDVGKTLKKYKKENPRLRLSLLHIDVDLYESTKVCLTELFPLVVRKGIIILDDYNKFGGASRAIDEFFRNKKIQIEKFSYCGSLSFVEVI